MTPRTDVARSAHPTLHLKQGMHLFRVQGWAVPLNRDYSIPYRNPDKGRLV